MKFSISYTNQEQKAIEVIKNLGGKNGDLNGSLAAKTNPGAFPTAIVEEKKSRKRWVIKVPKDKTELFIELFTGRLVQQLKQYLPEDARNDILCADIVKLHDGEGAWTYGLKQPLASFKELYYLTGSGTSYQSVLSSLAGVFSGISDAARGLLGYSVDSGPKMSIDRSAVLETLNGRAYYKAINDFDAIGIINAYAAFYMMRKTAQDVCLNIDWLVAQSFADEYGLQLCLDKALLCQTVAIIVDVKKTTREQSECEDIDGQNSRCKREPRGPA